MIVTCNQDFSVPLNSRVLATVDGDQAETQEMLHRANTQPELLEALEAMVADADTMNEPYRNEALCETARAAIAKAKGQ
jgi:hypothetical protein